MTITEQELQNIMSYLLEQPAKFSNPLINFFDGEKQQLAVKSEVEEKPSTKPRK